MRFSIFGTVGVILFGMTSPTQAATIFNIEFDGQSLAVGGGPLVGPIIGNGTFTSPFDLTPGTYDLSSLIGFSLTFSFLNGQIYSTSDIQTPLTGAAVRITDLGGGTQRLFFTEGSGPGVNGGPNLGALDLDNGTSALSFQPTYSGGNFLYFEGLSFGRYLGSSAAAVPEPATWAMMLIGFGLIGGAMRYRRHHQTRVRFAF